MQQAPTYEALQDYHSHQKWRETGEYACVSVCVCHCGAVGKTLGSWSQGSEFKFPICPSCHPLSPPPLNLVWEIHASDTIPPVHPAANGDLELSWSANYLFMIIAIADWLQMNNIIAIM